MMGHSSLVLLDKERLGRYCHFRIILSLEAFKNGRAWR